MCFNGIPRLELMSLDLQNGPGVFLLDGAGYKEYKVFSTQLVLQFLEEPSETFGFCAKALARFRHARKK